MVIEILSCPIKNGQLIIFNSYVELREGKSHQTPLNHHFLMVFFWFSYGFPNKTSGSSQQNFGAPPRQPRRTSHWELTAKDRARASTGTWQTSIVRRSHTNMLKDRFLHNNVYVDYEYADICMIYVNRNSIPVRLWPGPSTHLTWLVVDKTPLKNMSSSMGMMHSQYMEK